jgi:hypothetical protein
VSIRISEDWLKSVGFKWSQFDRQPSKMWTLWLGGCLECPADGEEDRRTWRSSDDEGFAIELTYHYGPDQVATDPRDDFWFCWFRSDTAGRYHRFIHVRHLRYQHEVIALVQAIGGREWKPENHRYGSVKCQHCADRSRQTDQRIDRVAMRERATWYEAEKDDTRDRALPEHIDAAIKGGLAK